MIDLSLFNKSQKSKSIRKYLDVSIRGKWKEFVERELRKYDGSLIFKGNLNKADSLKALPVKSIFLQELLEIWSEVNFEDVIKPINNSLSSHCGTTR